MFLLIGYFKSLILIMITPWRFILCKARRLTIEDRVYILFSKIISYCCKAVNVRQFYYIQVRVMYKIILESGATYFENMVIAIYFDIYIMSYRNCNVCVKPQKQKYLTRSTNVEMRSGESQRRNPINIRSLNTKLINVSEKRHELGSDNRSNDVIGRRRRGGWPGDLWCGVHQESRR